MTGAFSGGTFLSSSSTLGGATDIKLLSSCTGFTKIKHVKLEMLNGTRRAWITQNPLHYAGLIHSQRSVDPVIVRCGPSTASVSNLEGGSREEKSDSIRGHTFPNSLQVESLVTDICDTTSIAEFELKLGGFRLYVARDLNGKNNPPIPPSLPPVITNAAPEDVGSNGSVVPPTLAITKSKPSIGGIQRLLDTATDEGLAILQSPKVGYFRRSKTIKGKRAPPPCKEKQIVKEGQVLCYVEQLGGEVPIESDVSGEVIKILRQDGEPVGYGDPLIAILPSFPGIKKLQ